MANIDQMVMSIQQLQSWDADTNQQYIDGLAHEIDIMPDNIIGVSIAATRGKLMQLHRDLTTHHQLQLRMQAYLQQYTATIIYEGSTLLLRHGEGDWHPPTTSMTEGVTLGSQILLTDSDVILLDHASQSTQSLSGGGVYRIGATGAHGIPITSHPPIQHMNGTLYAHPEGDEPLMQWLTNYIQQHESIQVSDGNNIRIISDKVSELLDQYFVIHDDWQSVPFNDLNKILDNYNNILTTDDFKRWIYTNYNREPETITVSENSIIEGEFDFIPNPNIQGSQQFWQHYATTFANQRINAITSEGSPEERLTYTRNFFNEADYGYGFGEGLGYGQSQVDFTNWEFQRKVFNENGSLWWQAMNRGLLYHMEEARLLFERGLPPSMGSSESVRLWMKYLYEPSESKWYAAHNSSIATGYIAHENLMQHEPRSERIFITSVYRNVMYAEAIVNGAVVLPQNVGDPSGMDIIIEVDYFNPFNMLTLRLGDGTTLTHAPFPFRVPIPQIISPSTTDFENIIHPVEFSVWTPLYPNQYPMTPSDEAWVIGNRIAWDLYNIDRLLPQQYDVDPETYGGTDQDIQAVIQTQQFIIQYNIEDLVDDAGLTEEGEALLNRLEILGVITSVAANQIRSTPEASAIEGGLRSGLNALQGRITDWLNNQGF